MAVPWVFKFLAEELGGQAVYNVLREAASAIWTTSGVREKVGDAAAQVVRDTFAHDWTDEQYYVRAASKLEKAERVKLDRWLSSLKSDDQRNRFRKCTTQFKWEAATGGNKVQVYDLEATAEVLKAIAEYDDAEWRLFVRNVNLHKPMPAKQFIVMVRKSKPALVRWINAAQAAYDEASAAVIPAIDGFEARLAAQRTGRTKFGWEF
jgi:hypothetical protein